MLEALGKSRGPEDFRSAGQRYHDALQEGCELLIRAKMVPDRAGADTRVDVIIPLSDLLRMDGASVIEDTWLRARAGEHGYLSGADAEAIACDALIVPVVTGSPDWTVIGQMIALVTGAYAHARPAGQDGQPRRRRARALPPQAWEALQHALARLAIQFVSGPGAIASALRRGLLGAPLNTRSVILDVGYRDTVPDSIRHAVILRDRHCAWPGGCDRRPGGLRCPSRHPPEGRRADQRQGLRAVVQLPSRHLRPPQRLELRAPARRFHPRHQPRRQGRPPQPRATAESPTHRPTPRPRVTPGPGQPRPGFTPHPPDNPTAPGRRHRSH